MAIDMSTVKAITHNNKDVVKIEDSLGNVLWQKVHDIIYMSSSTSYQYELDNLVWNTKTWTGFTNLYGNCIWSDGTNIYYSGGGTNTQYGLDETNLTWSTKTWTGLSNVYGNCIWTDGTNIYHSRNGVTHKLVNGAWQSKTWTGGNWASLDGDYIWTDGTDIYCTRSRTTYVLDMANDGWSALTSANLPASGSNPPGQGWDMWSDGIDYYYSYGSGGATRYYYVFDKTTKSWSTKTFTFSGAALAAQNGLQGGKVYKYEGKYYFTYSDHQYVLDVATSTWTQSDFTNQSSSIRGSDIWDLHGHCLTEARALAKK